MTEHKIILDELGDAKPPTLRESNQERLVKLVRGGYPITIFQLASLTAALGVLVEHLLPKGPARNRYDEAVDREVEELIIQAEQQVNQARLIVPPE